jgi:predicted metal-dependent hydrolase
MKLYLKRYMIYLENNQSHTPKDASNLLNRARSLLSSSRVVIRDTRVSNLRIEFDTSIPDNNRIEEVIKELSLIAPISEYEHVVEKKLPKEEAIKYARSLFNFQKYWSAHEVLESVWKTSHGKEKDLLNGIILVAAAFVHDEKNESDICISILKRAMKKLDNATGNYFEVDVDKLKHEIFRIIETGQIQRFGI